MFKWLENNLMKSNPEKSHILMGSLKTERWQLATLYWPQVLKRNYLVLILIFNLNFKNTLPALETTPVKKYMFCPELQATCRWINGDFSWNPL